MSEQNTPLYFCVIRKVPQRKKKVNLFDKPSSSDVTLQIVIKCRRPSVLKLYLGPSLSSYESLYHITVALSKDNSHSKVAVWRSLTSMFWMHLVN